MGAGERAEGQLGGVYSWVVVLILVFIVIVFFAFVILVTAI